MLSLCSLLAYRTAVAGPWGQDPGEIYSRFAVSVEDRGGLAALRADLYAEVGLSRAWTLTAKLDHVHYPQPPGRSDPAAWRLTLRRVLMQQGGFVVAMESGVLQEAALAGRPACQDPGAELRGGLGWSGQVHNRDLFVFGELAGRAHAGCHRNRAEIGLGQRVAGQLWLISQVWLQRGAPDARSQKVQTELMRRYRWGDVAIGYQAEMAGEVPETAVLFSVARRF